jgi:hypothetical protein
VKIISVDLRVEAAAEARRLAAAREWLRDGDQRALLLLEGSGAWVASPRRASLRRLLGAGACLLWRLSLEDSSGRIIESRLVAVLVEATADVRRLVADPATEAFIRARIETDSSVWTREAMRVAGAFATARVSREREIEERPLPADAPSQPGLFDRRAERSRQTDAAAFAAGQQAMLERRRAAGGATAIALRPARLLLVLVP